MDLRTICHVYQVEATRARSDAVTAGRVVLAVIAGLDANAGQAQEWCRHSGNRRVFLPGDEQDRVVGRAHRGIRRRGRVHDIQDIFGWLVVS